ncbi:deacetylase [Legionella santicrucis]|uniref:Deacetylase n=1 Tax=Legionella santicrucis TaxID=45074 RepID=A0A0W0Z4H7_9GAMM|nr:polysaccharide deacetylase family protein [Legionella santicrucis]KTD63683.1 deacetylase [Legionella santicrucis]
MKKRIPIFYYHSIGGTGPETLDLHRFTAHLDALKVQSYTTITLADLFKEKYDATKQNAVLTFDDGLLDNYENALPLLNQYGFVATFFVVPGFDKITRWVHPGKRKWSNVQKTGYTIPYKNMQKNHRKALLNAGMEVGSHSFSHPKLHQIDRKNLTYEISDSKKYLEDELGIAIETFCYPYGGYNTKVVETVKNAGYLGATTTWPGYYNAERSLYKSNRFLIENPIFFSEVLKGKGTSAYAYLKSKFLTHKIKKSKF